MCEYVNSTLSLLLYWGSSEWRLLGKKERERQRERVRERETERERKKAR